MSVGNGTDGPATRSEREPPMTEQASWDDKATIERWLACRRRLAEIERVLGNPARIVTYRQKLYPGMTMVENFPLWKVEMERMKAEKMPLRNEIEALRLRTIKAYRAAHHGDAEGYYREPALQALADEGWL